MAAAAERPLADGSGGLRRSPGNLHEEKVRLGAAVRAERHNAGGNKSGGALLVNATTSNFQPEPLAARSGDGSSRQLTPRR